MSRTIAVTVVLCAFMLPIASQADTGMLRLHHQNLCSLRDLPGYEEYTYERAELEGQIADVENQLMWAYYDEGVAALFEGDYSTAVALLVQVSDWGMPDDLESYYRNCGHAHFHYGMENNRDPVHLELAARAYGDACLYSESSDPMYLVLQARALAALGWDAEARRVLGHFPGDRENDPEYWGCRSEAFGLLGDTDEERACMERAVAVAEAVAPPDAPSTAPVTTESVATTPAFSSEEVSAAEVYLEGQEAYDRGDYAAAAELFRRSLSIADDVWVWTMLGLTYDELGDAQQAENCYARVEGREPRTVAPSSAPGAAPR